MPQIIFNRETGLYVSGQMNGDIVHDSETHVQITLTDYPDRRLVRWDDDQGVRNATVLEISTFDKAVDAAKALSTEELFDMLKLKGLVDDTDRPRGRPGG